MIGLSKHIINLIANGDGGGGVTPEPPLIWEEVLPAGLNSGSTTADWYSSAITSGGNFIFTGISGYASILLSGQTVPYALTRGLYVGTTTADLNTITAVGDGNFFVGADNSKGSIIDSSGSFVRVCTQPMGFTNSTFREVTGSAYSTDTGIIFACSNGGEVVRSLDEGVSWDSVYNDNATVFGAMCSAGGIAACIGLGSSNTYMIIVSADEGVTWQSHSLPVPASSPDYHIHSIGCAAGLWYIGTGVEVYITSDFVSYTSITGYDQNIKISTSKVSADGVLVLCSENTSTGEVVYSATTDQGSTFTQITDLDASEAAYSIATDNSDKWVIGQRNGRAFVSPEL